MRDELDQAFEMEEIILPASLNIRTPRYSGKSGAGNRTADHSPAPGVDSNRHEKEARSRPRSRKFIINLK